MTLTRIGHVDVATLPPTACVEDAVRVMSERNLGSVVVVDGRRPIGILTDRDLVLRVLRRGLPPEGTQLAEVMSTKLVTAEDECPYDEAAWRMREHRVRRLPIVDGDGSLVGIVTLDDLVGKVAALRGDVAELLASFHAPDQQV